MEAPRRVLRGSTLLVEVTLEQTGYAGEAVDLEVMDDGRIVSSEQVRFPATGEAVVARVSFKADQAGARRFQFRTAPQRGEAVAENNRRRADPGRRPREKVLYFEGEPRFEVKFLRRAVAGRREPAARRAPAHRREQVLCASTSTSRGELDGGFPTTREELFRYDGLDPGHRSRPASSRTTSCA